MPARALPDPRLLFAAAHLRIGARRLRRLALGEDAALREWIADESASALARARTRARENYAAVESLGARVIALGDDGYPPGLRDLHDPPAFLTVRGDLPAAGIAIVGTRTPSPQARRFAYELAASLGTSIVSGLARGIDAAAHEGALGAGASTVAYVGTGIAQTYPPEHAELQERIIAHGAVASELLPDEGATRWSLVRRDRLQAAHARAVVLVATEPEGGAMHTMRFARRLVRRRFALDGDPRVVGEGNAVAIQDGASPLPHDLAAARAMICDALGEGAAVSSSFSPFDLDRVKRRSGLDIDALPFGVIVVDRAGTIVEYNAYERNLSGMGDRPVIGRNFFTDVAPCTAIADFQGRFDAFLDSPDTSIEPFEFLFPFPRGAQRVVVTFVRLSRESDRATICVNRIADGTRR